MLDVAFVDSSFRFLDSFSAASAIFASSFFRLDDVVWASSGVLIADGDIISIDFEEDDDDVDGADDEDEDDEDEDDIWMLLSVVTDL